MITLQAEHFFRHEYGQLVASLSRRIGLQHLALIEDAVQWALLKALESWPRTQEPTNPTAWLYKVAHNHIVDELRRASTHASLLQRHGEDIAGEADNLHAVLLASDISEDMLHMLFVSCDDAIPEESRLIFTLKSLCGFNVNEISYRLFTSEANVYKRFSRARKQLQTSGVAIENLTHTMLAKRLPAVHKTLYLMFTEGYLSTRSELSIRYELCEEALRLAHLLLKHSVGDTPETHALIALMHFHLARIEGRQDASGGLLLLEEQDRSTWNTQRIHTGLYFLERSANGDIFSRYHAEAGIAAEHCLAPSFQQTRWHVVVECYELLENIAPSAIHRLNRAVALAQWQGPEEGLAVLTQFEPPTWLAGSYLWHTVLADLHKRCQHPHEAEKYQQQALSLAPSPAIKKLIHRRLQMSKG